MSGPNPPGPESDELESGSEPSEDANVPSDDVGERSEDEAAGEIHESDQTSETEAYSQAYSAPESEHFTTGPYVPADLALYDYDSYDDSTEDEGTTARWPWIVGVAAIVAAIALVVSVALLVTRTSTNELATPGTAPTSTPPIQDEIIVTTPPSPPAPSPPTSAAPPPPSTSEAPPPPPTSESPAPPPATAAPPATTTAAAPPPPTSTTPAAPKQVTYSVTGTKAPFDQITITYVDASGMRRTQHNVYIPWTLTLTPISQSEVGSVEASSLLRLSRLNCSITTSDGTVLSSNETNAPQTSC